MIIKKFLTENIFFVILIIVLAIYLGFKAMPENSWDDWGFGSAQTMMSSKHWAQGGFINNKFLFLPSGYSEAVKYLDDKDLRQHAHGITTGDFIDNRLYYTHYPSGYLFPYAILMKMGVETRMWHRFLAIIFSLGAVVLMYLFFKKITTPAISFIATLFYGLSTMFLGMADSLANQPVDDLLRFAILFLSILAVNNINNEKKFKNYNILVWILYFILASSSYDSTFFIFVWLVGLDVITFKKINFKKWLIWGLAPVLAFFVQFLQNCWYLGLNDSLLDIWGSFKARANVGPGNIITRHIRAIFSPWSYMFNLRARFAIPIMIALLALLAYVKNKISYNFPKLSLIFLLGISACAYPFILPSSGYFPYQGRQIAPALCLLVASISVAIVYLIRNKKILISLLSLLLILTIWGIQIQRTYFYFLAWPNNATDQKIINLGNKAKESLVNQDGMVFRMEGNGPYRHPQVDPIMEYYMKATVLSFKYPEDLISDLLKIKTRYPKSLLPIILTENNEQKNIIKNFLDKEKIEHKFINSEDD